MRRMWLGLIAGVALIGCGDTTGDGTSAGSSTGASSTGGTSGASSSGGVTSAGSTTGSVAGSTTGSSTGTSSGTTSGGTTTGGATGLPDPACVAVPAGIPDALDAGPGVHVAIQAVGQGTQNYTCLFVDAGVAGWSAATPAATLFQCNVDGGAVGTHFGGPTWEWTADSSTFVANKPAAISAPSPDNPASDIPWLLLPKKTGTDAGVMGQVMFAERIQTVGGQVALSDAGCDLGGADAGLVVKVPYSATYLFYYQN